MGTSSFGRRVDGREVGDYMVSDEWWDGVKEAGRGSKGGCTEDGTDGDEYLSNCCNLTIISSITNCCIASKLRRMSNDSAWLLRRRSKDSKWCYIEEQRDSIFENTKSWQATWSASAESWSSTARALVAIPSVIALMKAPNWYRIWDNFSENFQRREVRRRRRKREEEKIGEYRVREKKFWPKDVFLPSISHSYRRSLQSL